jgi:hypothetical protein
MAAGDVTYGYGTFAPGETVNLAARDVTPGVTPVSLAKSGVVAANGGLTIATVPATVVQHGTTQRVLPIGTGATSGRVVGGFVAS